jgi:hypothetical protein
MRKLRLFHVEEPSDWDAVAPGNVVLHVPAEMLESILVDRPDCPRCGGWGRIPDETSLEFDADGDPDPESLECGLCPVCKGTKFIPGPPHVIDDVALEAGVHALRQAFASLARAHGNEALADVILRNDGQDDTPFVLAVLRATIGDVRRSRAVGCAVAVTDELNPDLVDYVTADFPDYEHYLEGGETLAWLYPEDEGERK